MNSTINDLVKTVLDETKTALLEVVTTDAPQILEAVNSYISNAQGRFADLLMYMARGGSAAFLLDRLSEEKDILHSEVLSFVVIGKSVAQNIVNHLQDILLRVVRVVLPSAAPPTEAI